MSAMIILENITKCYQLGDNQVPILRGIDLHIQPGEYVSIMGASGSGKSTLMNIIGCLDQPTDGQYFLDNRNLTTFTKDELALIRNQQIGFVFQQFNLLPRSTALENVMLPMIYAGIPKSERRCRAVEMLDRVGLGDRLMNRPSQLSGGQQQRVAIARALVNNPALLLADEPTGALDSQTSQEVMNLFQTLNQQDITIVVITHELEVATQAQRRITICDGQILNHSKGEVT
ncbi:macrolide export ATP-binding/permease protein, putative [Acaryochloris marina MBIC11017]|uniref:Macrolide export ATP-binding/permease protein, putative n=2 Tax=Acaryochloris marina TaxID=155978 RepID=B0C5Z3_ACAM1|nr:macrolide export ATP-binding/permease protein, putative [Acaryochloris marina MBIC11017]